MTITRDGFNMGRFDPSPRVFNNCKHVTPRMWAGRRNVMNENLEKFFTRFGEPSDKVEVNVGAYIVKADTLDTAKEIRDFDATAANLVSKCEQLIDVMKTYRASLVDQYNYLETAPTASVVELKREYYWYEKKSYYYLSIYKRYIDSGHDVLVSHERFAGRDRHKAIAAYKDYVKSHPGVIEIMDIEKHKWER